jgi:hypothetical protein
MIVNRKEPKRKAFKWTCPNCNNWIRVVPPDSVMEIRTYMCGYDGYIMKLEVIDACSG